jgi:GTPase SAR1 family protein
MSRLYYRAARAACVCYDLTRAETWPKVKFWINELLSFEKECALYVLLPAAFSTPPLARPRGVALPC